MPHNNAHNLILRYGAMQHKAKPHQHPRQIRGGEDQQPQERELGIRVAARPDVDEDAGEGVAEEDHGDEGGEGDEKDAGVEEEPGEVGGGAAGGFFEEAGVALHEEDVEDEVEGEGAEVEEGACEAPELGKGKDGVEAVKELKRADDVALDEDAGEDCCGGPETTQHSYGVQFEFAYATYTITTTNTQTTGPIAAFTNAFSRPNLSTTKGLRQVTSRSPTSTLPPTSQDTNHTHDVPSARAARVLPLQRGDPQILQRQNYRHHRLKAHVLQRSRARRPHPTAQKASLPPRHRGTTRNPAIPAHDRPSDAEAPLLAAGARDCDDARAEEPGTEVAEPGDSGAAGGGGGVLGASV
ncbi:hypothetical protein V494_03223 [Pseudogymnoascus sp. VKM F-4513 (FW-928)]|nr:hypothetical protein V494_03223 [Pseudogymnoascus sp. VKM F-4513 (FW-928)]